MSTSIRKRQTIAGGVRCFKCHKLLARDDLKQNVLEIKCVRCGALNAIFRGVEDQVIVTDQDGIILYANSVVEKVTGYSLGEVLGRKPSLWGGQMPKEFYREMWHCIKTQKKSVVVRVTNKRKDGTLYKANLRISPVLDTEGEIRMFVGMETVTR